MGRKGKGCESMDKLLPKTLSMQVLSNMLEDFEMRDAEENKKCEVIEMRGKEGYIPEASSGFEDIVFDSYYSPVETLSHRFVCKPTYLRLYRCRYKRADMDKHYSNEYDVTLKEVKMVPALGISLRERLRNFL
ncbi:MAG: hypothetical protein LBI60_04610 [Bacteroidales bacterium]|jgi:hypothetical protein|nr:hypothetical protein [Bacteroidales bacterium]